MRKDDETDGHLGRYEMLVVEWHNMTIDADGNATLVASEMIHTAGEDRCVRCGEEAFMRLDFSSLAATTTRPHSH
jgi:hypothetical protein